MHISQVLKLLNKCLSKIDPVLKIGPKTSETTIEKTLDTLLSMVKSKSSKSASLRLAARRKKPIPSSLPKFLASQAAAGIPVDKAFKQAQRLGIPGATDE